MAPNNFMREYGKYTDDEKQTIRERFRDILTHYETFKRDLIPHLDGKGFYLNQTVLFTICCLYMNDLKEVKILHGTEKGGDNHKRAAYLARLNSNFRPIISDEVEMDEQKKSYRIVLLVNEMFALTVFEMLLGVPRCLLDDPDYDKVQRDLIFIFCFRDPQKELLVATARLVGMLVKAKGASDAVSASAPPNLTHSPSSFVENGMSRVPN